MKIEQLFDKFVFQDYSYHAISRQELIMYFLRMWIDKTYAGINIDNVSLQRNPIRVFNRWCKTQERKKMLTGHMLSTRGYRYFIINSNNISPEEVICGVYKYGYLSHLSALRHYQIVTAKNNTIYFTVPDKVTWKKLFLEQLDNFLPERKVARESLEYDFLWSVDDNDLIPNFPIEDELNGYQINIITQKVSSNVDEWGNLRIEALPDLYLSIMRNVQYSGGFKQVLKVYENIRNEEFINFLNLLNSSVANDIDRARVGFIFEKILRRSHDFFNKWKVEQKNKRGGSRKLLPHLPFSSIYDEDWNISVNSEIAKPFASSYVN